MIGLEGFRDSGIWGLWDFEDLLGSSGFRV